MTPEFEPFFTLAGTFGVTLWVLTIAILTIVLASATVGSDLGVLSAMARNALGLIASRQTSDELRAAFETFVGQYRAIWFMVEMLPIPMYFQIVMLLSLCCLIPNLPLEWLAFIPMAHVVGWSAFVRFLKRNQQRFDAALADAGLERSVVESVPGVHFLTTRMVLWQIPLVLFSVAILWSPSPVWAVLISVVLCILAGIVQTMRVTANIIIARR